MSEYIFLLQTKRIHRQLQKHHKSLVHILDNVELNATEDSSKIIMELSSFEKLAETVGSLYENDRVLASALAQLHKARVKRIKTLKYLKTELKLLKHENKQITQKLSHENQSLTRAFKHIHSIVSEFRERQIHNSADYLKDVSMELRKILKPLVPTNVLDEHMKYRQISLDPSLINSLSNTQQEIQLEGQEGGAIDEEDDKLGALNSHISMLIGTLESTAKYLIELLNGVTRKYYEFVDPKVIDSEPPTPIAAPLPEYFSYEAKDYSPENYDDIKDFDSKDARKLMEKLINLQNKTHTGVLTPDKADQLRRKLERLEQSKVSREAVHKIFNDVLSDVKDREAFTFNLLDSGRPGENDVTLRDLLDVRPAESNQTSRRSLTYQQPIDIEYKISEHSHITHQSYEQFHSSFDKKRSISPVGEGNSHAKLYTPTPRMDEFSEQRYRSSDPESYQNYKKKPFPPVGKGPRASHQNRKLKPMQSTENSRGRMTPNGLKKARHRFPWLKRRKSTGNKQEFT